MRNIIFMALFAAAACTAPGEATPSGASPAPEPAPVSHGTLTGAPPIVIAHRGASGLYPEHTERAYRAAIEQGADFIEPDLMMTRDGVLIARHDHYLSATTNISELPEFADRKRVRETPLGQQDDWWTDDFTIEELKTLKARQQFPTRDMAYNDQFDILTFDEVIDIALDAAAEGRVVGLHVEAKWPEYFSSVGLDMVDPIINTLEQKRVREAGIPVFIQSFESPFLAAFAEKSDLPTIQNMVGPPFAAMLGLEYNLEDLETAGVGAEKSYILNSDGTSSDFVQRAHAQGLLVHVYTVRDDRPAPGFSDSRAELRALFNAGVDGIWVDYPETAVAVRDGN